MTPNNSFHKARKAHAQAEAAIASYVYSDNYLKRNYGRNAQGIIQSYIAYKLSRIINDIAPRRILEIGVGTSPTLKNGNRQGVMVISDRQYSSIALLSSDSQMRYPPICSVEEAKHLPYHDQTFDCVVAASVLEHTTEPWLVLLELCRVTRAGGRIVLLVPTDPSVLWRIGQMLGPRKRTHLEGHPYDYIQALEHVTSSFNIRSCVRYLFSSCKEEYWPTQIPIMDINLFLVLIIDIV